VLVQWLLLVSEEATGASHWPAELQLPLRALLLSILLTALVVTHPCHAQIPAMRTDGIGQLLRILEHVYGVVALCFSSSGVLSRALIMV